MHILVLSNVPPGAVGGAEVQARRLAFCWASAGHAVTIAGYANVEMKEGRLTILRLPTLRGSRILRGATYLASTLWFLWVRRHEFDVIYCRFMKEQAIVACLARALFRFRQPIVACPAGSDRGGDIAYIKRSRLRFLWRPLLARNLSCINVMTRRIEAEVRLLAFAGPRISNIPNGVVVPTGVPNVWQEEGSLRIVFVGRLVPVKGVDLLLEACERLKGSGHKFTVEIIGDGPLRASLEAKTNASWLRDCIRYTGQLPPESIPERLTNADLFVLPSRSEGFPGSLLEACACALPAVVTRVSGSEVIVNHETGWIVPPEDAQGLADALSEACSIGRTRLRMMGARARDRVQRDYSIEKVAAQYEILFRELLTSTQWH